MVSAHSLGEWLIESPAAPSPMLQALEAAVDEVELVIDYEARQARKLWMVNGAHQALALMAWDGTDRSLGVIEMDGTSVPRPAGAERARLPETEQRGFAELLCADPAWVRAEFDAIIAANFGDAAEQPEVPPNRPPRPARDHRGRSGGAGRRLGPPAWAGRGDLARTARQVGARERSPPPPRGGAAGTACDAVE